MMTMKRWDMLPSVAIWDENSSIFLRWIILVERGHVDNSSFFQIFFGVPRYPKDDPLPKFLVGWGWVVARHINPSAYTVSSEFEGIERKHVVVSNCFHCLVWDQNTSKYINIQYSSSFDDFSLKSILFRSECPGLTLPRSVLRMFLKEICKSFARRFIFDFLLSYEMTLRFAQGGLNTAFSHVYKPSDSNSCMPGDSNEPRMIVASERATVHFRGWSAATKRPGWTRKILELWFVLLCQVMNTNKDMCFCVLYTVSLPVSMFFLWRLCFWCPKQSKGALGGFRFVAERLQKWRNLVAQWWFDHRGIGPIRGRSWAFHTYIVV